MHEGRPRIDSGLPPGLLEDPLEILRICKKTLVREYRAHSSTNSCRAHRVHARKLN